MRWLLPFLIVFAGCVATLPGDDGLTADLACETARMVVQLRQQIPAQTSPTRPATPSAIVTMTYVSMASIANVYVSSQSQGSAVVTHFSNSTADKTFAYVVVG